MTKEELRAEYEGNGTTEGNDCEEAEEWSREQSIAFMSKLASEYYADTGGETSLAEIEGLKLGVIYCYSDEDKGRLPEYIKNIRVYAIRSFERLSSLFQARNISQETYLGFMKGYLYGYKLYCDSLL